jgi:hypothetical protein
MLSLTLTLDHSGQSAPRPGCFACHTGGSAGPRVVLTGTENLAFTEEDTSGVNKTHLYQQQMTWTCFS